MAPQALSFARNAAGKPRLQWGGGLTAQGAPLHFSLSHTEALLGALPGALHMPSKRTWLQLVLQRAVSLRGSGAGQGTLHCPTACRVLGDSTRAGAPRCVGHPPAAWP